MATTLKTTMCAARDGGIAIWIEGQPEPVFAGDAAAFTKYIGERAQALMAAAAKERAAEEDPREVEEAQSHSPYAGAVQIKSRGPASRVLLDRLAAIEEAESA